MLFAVCIPFSSFIDSWSDKEDGSYNWLKENVGKPQQDWRANYDPVDPNYALFWFKREEDAVAFKLRWM